MSSLPITYENFSEAFWGWCAENAMDPKDRELHSAFLGGVMHVESIAAAVTPVLPPINYATLCAFAEAHRVNYNELCVAVRSALSELPTAAT